MTTKQIQKIIILAGLEGMTRSEIHEMFLEEGISIPIGTIGRALSMARGSWRGEKSSGSIRREGERYIRREFDISSTPIDDMSIFESFDDLVIYPWDLIDEVLSEYAPLGLSIENFIEASREVFLSRPHTYGGYIGLIAAIYRVYGFHKGSQEAEKIADEICILVWDWMEKIQFSLEEIERIDFSDAIYDVLIA